MWQEYLQVDTEFRFSNILVGIYLEAEDFEYFRKFRKKERSTFVAKAIEHYREKYSNPVFLIRCNNYVWALKRFKPELEEHLLGRAKNEKLRNLNIHFPDKGKIWRYVEDFALIRKGSKMKLQIKLDLPLFFYLVLTSSHLVVVITLWFWGEDALVIANADVGSDRSHFSWWMGYSSQGYAVLPNIYASNLGNVKTLKLPWIPIEF